MDKWLATHINGEYMWILGGVDALSMDMLFARCIGPNRRAIDL